MNIPIIIAAYNRVEPLQRLLHSLARARYDVPVKLIISIDGGGSPDVVSLAKQYAWAHGEKEIIVQEKNIGLRQHILFCGGLTTRYDGVIVLEDDLYVSPWFYRYAQEAALYYRESSEISGIALYSPRFNESARLPFYPLDDGHDVFFMQVACSWGQVWLKGQWEGFANWYADNAELQLAEDMTLPYEMRQWPDTSWKKYFIKYMVENDTYFVYPRYSLTTNFGDAGSHHTGTRLYQVPLLQGEKGICFVDCAASFVKYDAFSEMIPESLASLCPHLEGVDFVVDLYGIKEEQSYTQPYVLTTKRCKGYLRSFGRHLLPPEHNVIDDVPGDQIFLAPAGEVEPVDVPDYRLYIYTRCASAEEQKYYYNITDLHYFLLQKEIKKFTSLYSMENEKTKEMRQALGKVRSDLQQANKMLYESRKNTESIRKSTSYRIGNAIIFPLSYLKRLITKG